MNIVNGFPEDIDLETRLDLRRRMSANFSSLINGIRDQIMSAKDPLREGINLVVNGIANSVQVDGLENIPENGPVILAMNHPFPTVDDFSLLSSVAERFSKRPWAFIANINSISSNVPNWKDMPSFAHRIIPVERENGESFGRVTNGRSVVSASQQFLTMHEDPILLVAPNGSDDIFCDRISDPHLGFTRIALATNASIVPVLYTGGADLDTLRFDVKGKILPPMEYNKNDSPAMIASTWREILFAELNRQIDSPAT